MIVVAVRLGDVTLADAGRAISVAAEALPELGQSELVQQLAPVLLPMVARRIGRDALSLDQLIGMIQGIDIGFPDLSEDDWDRAVLRALDAMPPIHAAT